MTREKELTTKALAPELGDPSLGVGLQQERFELLGAFVTSRLESIRIEAKHRIDI